MIPAETLIAADAAGPILKLEQPISFWGGIDPRTGRIADPGHPAHGRTIAGTVLALRQTRGSSSSSAVMLELMRGGLAPAALILAEVDAILSLGVVVGREMGYSPLPVLRLDAVAFATLPDGAQARIVPGGGIEIGPA